MAIPEKKVIKIQPKMRKDLTLPYPYFIDDDGYVGRQDFWKGTPLKLIGFNLSDKQIDDDSITFAQFWKNPELAIGKYPIFMHQDGEWYTYKDPIDGIKR